METTFESPFDEEFLSIWSAMQSKGIGPLAIAGGYGLLLKQRWLGEQVAPDMLVPFDRWVNPRPRATKDFDFVVDLDFIRDKESQGAMADLLKEFGYVVNERNRMWQFEKSVGQNQKIIVEFHAETPAPGEKGVNSCRIRVKHKPSLKDKGIHARNNPEAVGCDESPFQFAIHDQDVLVPNPVTWAIMKLTAMADQTAESKMLDQSAENRTFFRKQSEKHAGDVCRIIAMISREELERVPVVVGVLKNEPAFRRAVEIVAEFFNDDGDGTMMTEGAWEKADHDQIRELLGSWFAA